MVSLGEMPKGEPTANWDQVRCKIASAAKMSAEPSLQKGTAVTVVSTDSHARDGGAVAKCSWAKSIPLADTVGALREPQALEFYLRTMSRAPGLAALYCIQPRFVLQTLSWNA